MKLRYKIGSVVVLLASVYLWGRCNKTQHVAGPQLAPVLPVNDKEQVLIDPVKHTITVITQSGSKTTTLPDRVSTVDIRKDGTVNVTSKQFGTELRPFAGVYYSDALRFGAGVDVLYFKRLDLGFGLAGMGPVHTVVFVQCTYNVWDNIGLSLMYDHMRHVGGAITLRI